MSFYEFIFTSQPLPARDIGMTLICVQMGEQSLWPGLRTCHTTSKSLGIKIKCRCEVVIMQYKLILTFYSLRQLRWHLLFRHESFPPNHVI